MTGYVIKAGTIIYKGTLVMHVDGVFRPAASGITDSVLAGIALETYDEAGASGTDVTRTKPMVFQRDPFMLRSATGADQLVDGSRGVEVAIKNDQELKKIIATDDLTVRAISRESELDWICEIV